MRCWAVISSVVTGLVAAFVSLGALAASTSITVTNTTNVINGDVSTLNALMARPGFDGISLHEAVAAANNTSGTKEIHFSPSLRGQPIAFEPSNPGPVPYLVITGGDLTIDGDVDGDGLPDITLEGTQGHPAAIDIRASNTVINGLILHAGNEVAINFTCLDTVCASRDISNVRITNNHIESDGIACVGFAVWGALDPATTAPLLSDITFSDATIEGNRFRCGDTCIALRPGVAGATRNSVRNVVIRKNTFTTSHGGYEISVDVADTSVPPLFSDDSLLENLTIEQNTFIDGSPAIELLAGNWGNRRAILRHVAITNNAITTTADAESSIRIVAAQEPRFRATSDNLIDDVTISGNDITGGAAGIEMSAAAGGLTGLSACERNTLRNVTVAANRIRDYGTTGIALSGGRLVAPGDTSTDNLVDAIVIVGNLLEARPGIRVGNRAGEPVGLQVLGGDDKGADANSLARNVVNVSIGGNTLRGNATAIDLIGGWGNCTDNTVSVLWLGPNDFQGNETNVIVRDDVFHASGNRVTTLSYRRRRAARH